MWDRFKPLDSIFYFFQIENQVYSTKQLLSTQLLVFVLKQHQCQVQGHTFVTILHCEGKD